MCTSVTIQTTIVLIILFFTSVSGRRLQLKRRSTLNFNLNYSMGRDPAPGRAQRRRKSSQIIEKIWQIVFYLDFAMHTLTKPGFEAPMRLGCANCSRLVTSAQEKREQSGKYDKEIGEKQVSWMCSGYCSFEGHSHRRPVIFLK